MPARPAPSMKSTLWARPGCPGGRCSRAAPHLRHGVVAQQQRAQVGELRQAGGHGAQPALAHLQHLQRGRRGGGLPDMRSRGGKCLGCPALRTPRPLEQTLCEVHEGLPTGQARHHSMCAEQLSSVLAAAKRQRVLQASPTCSCVSNASGSSAAPPAPRASFSFSVRLVRRGSRASTRGTRERQQLDRSSRCRGGRAVGRMGITGITGTGRAWHAWRAAGLLF